jgi:acrylyl-CoA reductase (NADPH)
MPFILRNVRLQGVDSVMVPTAERAAVWASGQLAGELLPAGVHRNRPGGGPAFAADFLSNKIQGRTLVKING